MRVRRDIRNGIKPSARKWLAAQQAANGEPGAAARAEAPHGFIGVARAGRIKPAAGKIHGRQKRLIGAEKEKQGACRIAGAIFRGWEITRARSAAG